MAYYSDANVIPGTVWQATGLMIQAQLCDKTFLLIGLLCIIYSGIELQRQGEDSGVDNQYVRMLRIFASSFIGVCAPIGILVNQQNMYVYEIKIIVSVVLCGFLSIYMYRLCKESIGSLNDEELIEKQNRASVTSDKTQLLEKMVRTQQDRY